MDKRARFVGILLGAATLLLVGRLFFWQVVKGAQLAQYARSQYLRSEQIATQRGSILASDGGVLATSQITWQMWADPTKLTKKPQEIARLLAPIFTRELLPEDASGEAQLSFIENKEEQLEKALGKRDIRWVLLADKLSNEAKLAVENFALPGVGWTLGETRFYPEGSAAAHLLGFVGKDEGGERGYFGLEGFYDVTLKGVKGIQRAERDVRGNPIPFGLFSEIAPQSGLDIVTFIDRTVQYIIERHLASGIEKYGAKGGSVVVMKPTGEVLASASFPSYDHARYSEADSTLFKNPAVADSFEPGSVFKVLVMAAALDSGAVKPDTRCDACSGPVTIGKYQIHTWDDKYYPQTSMTDVIKHSDNIGMAFVGGRLGGDKMWDYLSGFGIGRLTDIDLQEESTPALRGKGKWGDIDVATTSFGQGVAVTPIQLVRAVAAIANHGILPVPRVVDKMGEGREGTWEQEIPAKDEGRVISEDAAAKITEMMIEAVRAGEAKWAAPKGFLIAGKTGTAQIPIAGHYSPEKTIASFIGFAPADDPEFVMLVSLREPTSSPFGSETAAPLWFSIARDLFPYFGIGPSQ